MNRKTVWLFIFSSSLFSGQGPSIPIIKKYNTAKEALFNDDSVQLKAKLDDIGDPSQLAELLKLAEDKKKTFIVGIIKKKIENASEQNN